MAVHQRVAHARRHALLFVGDDEYAVVIRLEDRAHDVGQRHRVVVGTLRHRRCCAPEGHHGVDGTCCASRGQPGQERGLTHIEGRNTAVDLLFDLQQTEHQRAHRGGTRGDARRMREGVTTLDDEIQTFQKTKILLIINEILFYLLLKLRRLLTFEKELHRVLRASVFADFYLRLGVAAAQGEAYRRVVWQLVAVLAPVFHDGDV